MPAHHRVTGERALGYLSRDVYLAACQPAPAAVEVLALSEEEMWLAVDRYGSGNCLCSVCYVSRPSRALRSVRHADRTTLSGSGAAEGQRHAHGLDCRRQRN